jgi:transcriptional regulator with XRE-family HTH domain
MNYADSTVNGLDPKEFGRRLKALRLEMDLTLIRMAEPAGTTGETLRALENGERPRPNERTIYRLLKAYPQLAEPKSEEERAS